MNEEVEIMVNTSTNVTNALMHCRKLEKTMLQVHLNDLNREEKKRRSFIDRRRAAFLQTFKIRRKEWWKMDTHVRENVRKDLDHLIIKKVNEVRTREAELAEIENKKNNPINANSVYLKKATIDYRHTMKNPLPPITSSNVESNTTTTPRQLQEFGNSKIPTILNHYTFPKNQPQPQAQQQQQKDTIYFKPNKMKLPEIQQTTQRVSINEHLNKGGENIKEGLMHEKYAEIYRTKSIILPNIQEQSDSVAVIESTTIKLEHQSSVASTKLQNLSRNPTKLNSNSQSNLNNLNNNSSMLMRASLAANYNDRSDYINQLKANGELSKEEEDFIDTLSRFLKRSPFYVESSEKYKASNKEKAVFLKSKNKEKKISQLRDKRFENLVDSLVDFKAEFSNYKH